MIDEVMDRFYRIEVPLPNSPLKELNSYVIKGAERNLIIDTGFNRTVCLEAMQEGIRALDIDLAVTDFFITHMHADHAGLVTRLATDTSTIYFSRIDAQVYQGKGNWQSMIDYAGINGFPEEELIKALNSHPGFKYSPDRVPDLTLVGDGDCIEIGDYRFSCLSTPGHTQGHICLYEAAKKVLLSGDHVLFDITPHIESWSYQVNALQDYLESLDKIYDLPVDIVLPGHRSFFSDLKGRIDELKKHHEDRANEVIDVVGKKRKTAYEIAAGMTWDIDCETWDLFPITQKWFATGEAIAHLRFLESEKRVHRNTDRKTVTFST